MKHVDLAEMYKTPKYHQPPDISGLTNDTMYPNMNSIEYRNKPLVNNPTPVKRYNFLERIDIDENGMVAVAANTYTNRIWSGALWGYKNFDDTVTNKNIFALDCKAPITNLKYIEASMVRL